MARNNITYLRANLRSLIDDPSDGNTVFSEDDLDDALWKRKDEARYYHLDSVSTISAGGTTTTYLTFDAPVGNWATDVALVDSSYNALSPVTSDYVQGRWTFSTEPKLPVMITGYTFALYGAAGTTGVVVVFQQASGVDSYVYSARATTSHAYIIKAIAAGESSAPAWAAAERVEALLTDQTITLSSGHVLMARRDTILSMTETDGGEMYQHAGGIYNIMTQE